MNIDHDFTNNGQSLIEWLSNYFNTIEENPVKPSLSPGIIEKSLPVNPPVQAESFHQIFKDFKEKIMPGITHWQHPGYHAYFPANNSEPSILAEILTAGLGVQGMKWITSPSATELEKVIMRWLQQMLGLPSHFKGVLMDTASVATLCAILAARERVTNYKINEDGFTNQRLRVYCSGEAHSSIEKAVRIAGIGSKNLVKVKVDDQLKMIPGHLEDCIHADVRKGFIPACIVGALGTTGTCAIDPLDKIAEIASENNLWFHVDAAYAGTALLLQEFKEQVPDFSSADSFVFNPHKWMFTNFDCSAFFIKNQVDLTKTFSLIPAYLQSDQDDDLDYSNWSIQLGRRFRSLKLWFVIRSFGVKGLQDKVRKHIELGKLFESFIHSDDRFELAVPRNLNVVCFRLKQRDTELMNKMNKALLDKINASGKVFLSHTLINSTFVLRFVCGQTNVNEKHIHRAWDVILSAAETILTSSK